jgi:hypothetical protein
VNEPASISTQYLETVLGRESIYDGLSDAQRLTRRMRRLRATALQRAIYRWAAEHRPEWIGHTQLPAYHWLSFGGDRA